MFVQLRCSFKVKMKFVFLFVLVTNFFLNVFGRNFPELYLQFDEITSTEVPDPRQSLDDCVVRYRKFAAGSNVGDNFGIGGIAPKLKEFPHLAAVGWTVENGAIIYDCGGSLISEMYVLTAGHCTSRNFQPPDTVRVGDLNLKSKKDDEHAQHFKIAEIIRHPEYKFSARYNDIALLKLERPITVNSVVCPACLFTDSDFEYEEMVATGWGDTGYGQNKSDVLLKFTLVPVSLKECNEHYLDDRFLKKGLVDHQFCAFDTKMDTCSGDSGGPMEVKLVSNNRLVPFIIGITSFGAPCGMGSPGVYIKLAPFIPWIESVVGINFDPHECTLRNIDKRQRVTNIDINVIGSRNPEHVYISSINSQSDWFCDGSLISEDFVVTSASCLENRNPDIIEVGVGDSVQKLEIKRIVIHPEFQNSTWEHNIALIQLEKDVALSKEIFPSCVWLQEQLPKITRGIDISGRGPKVFQEYWADKSAIADLEILLNFDTSESCTKKITSQNEFCAGFPQYYLVPRTCSINNGTALERIIQNNQHLYNYLFGIYSHGSDCGFGKPAVFTRLASYVRWMESVMFIGTPPLLRKDKVNDTRTQVDNLDEIIFIDEYQKPEACLLVDGGIGRCVILYRCRVFLDNTKYGSAAFCNAGNQRLICCPIDSVA